MLLTRKLCYIIHLCLILIISFFFHIIFRDTKEKRRNIYYALVEMCKQREKVLFPSKKVNASLKRKRNDVILIKYVSHYPRADVISKF